MESPGKILKRYGLAPKKSFGQCFLNEVIYISRMVKRAGINADDIVVEIGAGLGTLTGALSEKADKVFAIERDRDLVKVLKREFEGQSKIEIIEANALTFDFSQFSKPVKVVGNLPYNISSPLLFYLLDHREHIKTATLMFQREVAERLIAKPGTSAYGAPSVFCQLLAEVEMCYVVPRGAFLPSPNVDSAVIHLQMRASPILAVDEKMFQKIVRQAFGKRRKTLKNALKASFASSTLSYVFQAAGIDGNRRGETLSIEEFGTLAQAFVEVEIKK